jgi:acetoin:2,6-dichlorophenolindophenol oxidoreductase subunit beta
MLTDTRRLSYSDALLEATEQEMARDENVVVMGLGVDDWRGIYGTTEAWSTPSGPSACSTRRSPRTP